MVVIQSAERIIKICGRIFRSWIEGILSDPFSLACLLPSERRGKHRCTRPCTRLCGRSISLPPRYGLICLQLLLRNVPEHVNAISRNVIFSSVRRFNSTNSISAQCSKISAAAGLSSSGWTRVKNLRTLEKMSALRAACVPLVYKFM